MIKLTFLGVEGYPQAGRMTISTMVEHGNTRVLLDCGASIIQQLDQCNLTANDISSVFISHLHADHSSGLPLLIYSLNMERFEKRASGSKVINILGNLSILAPLLDYCKSAYPALFLPDNPVRVNLIDTVSNLPQSIGDGIKIITAKISHAVPGEAISMIIGDQKICYTADTRYTEELAVLARNSNVIIGNVFGDDEEKANKAGFLSSVKAAELASIVRAQKLVMLHLYSDAQRDIAKRTAKNVFNGEVFTPTNGQSISL